MQAFGGAIVGNDTRTPEEVAAALEGVRIAAVEAQFAARLAAGLPYQGQVIDIDAPARADLGGMALTAALVNMGQLTWPEDISRGWVARGNARVPLPTPADGIALATTAAGYYSALVQHESDLIADPSLDPAAGWP